MASSSNTNKETGEMNQFLRSLPGNHLEPLWTQMGAMVPPSPNPSAVPYLWKYTDALPRLEDASRLVPEEQAERRVLMLVNPNLGKFSLF